MIFQVSDSLRKKKFEMKNYQYFIVNKLQKKYKYIIFFYRKSGLLFFLNSVLLFL